MAIAPVFLSLEPGDQLGIAPGAECFRHFMSCTLTELFDQCRVAPGALTFGQFMLFTKLSSPMFAWTMIMAGVRVGCFLGAAAADEYHYSA